MITYIVPFHLKFSLPTLTKDTALCMLILLLLHIIFESILAIITRNCNKALAPLHTPHAFASAGASA